MGFYQFFLSLDWDIVNGITSIMGVIITSLLTFIIISQTHKLNLKQTQMEEKINSQQIQLIKRQIKVDSFPYKRDIYLNIFRIFEFTHFFMEMSNKLDLSTMSTQKLYELYKIAVENHLGNAKKILESIRESEYILPNNISPTVYEILKSFDDICSKFIVFGTLNKILTEEELAEMKTENIQSILHNFTYINSKVSFIQSIMPKELDISTLDR